MNRRWWKGQGPPSITLSMQADSRPVQTRQRPDMYDREEGKDDKDNKEKDD